MTSPLRVSIRMHERASIGGFIWGILPSRLGISWQGHLFSFLGGVAAAYLVTRLNHQESEVPPY